MRSRTWTAGVATRPRRCMSPNSVKALRRSRRETDTTIMTRVIELLYFGKIVDVFVAHGALRVGGMKKRQTPMTRSYQTAEVAQERSCFMNLCHKTYPTTFMSVEATLVSCLEGNSRVSSRMDQAVVRWCGGGAKGAIRATTTQRLRAQAVERTARVMTARDRAMTFCISSLHLDVKGCALTCCPLPRPSISAASLTVLTAGGCGRPYIVGLGDISFRFDITDLKVTTNIMRAATCPRTGRDSGDSEYANQSCYYRRELIECR